MEEENIQKNIEAIEKEKQEYLEEQEIDVDVMEFSLMEEEIDELIAKLQLLKETKEPIPTELLNSISKNLFTSEKGELEKVVHPADELASALLGSASKLKLNLGGNQLEFDKPGKISKSKSRAGAKP